jgi:hypothetical protein
MNKKEKTYELIINNGLDGGYERHILDKKSYIKESAKLLTRPKKIFLGLGDFLELGDYNNLIDAVLLDQDVAKLEGIIDKNNRKISEEGDIPFSFFKLAVYYPDFLFKDVPVECISTIGRKARLFPGSEVFIRNIKKYNPLVLTAIPYEISIEYMKRMGLGKINLLATEYKKTVVNKKEIFTGDIVKFISGNRRSLAIEKVMAEMDYRNDDVLYIGRGEAGSNTFTTYNSIAFNPAEGLLSKPKYSLYGSTLESLLVLFNYDNELEDYLMSDQYEENLPSMIVYSHVKEKSRELIDLELEHRQMQENIIGLKIEHSEDSYASLEREINVLLGASTVNISMVRNMIFTRMQKYLDDPQGLVRDIYSIARERYKNFCTV